MPFVRFEEGGGLMTPLREKMVKAMQLRGLALSTQESYQRAVFSPTGFWSKPCSCADWP